MSTFADARVRIGDEERWFVDYLREAIRFGGFCGLARANVDRAAADGDLASITEGLQLF